MIIYKYSRYSREQEERIDATPDAVLHRAFSDIEGNTAYPLAICAEDGSIIFDERTIHQRWEESEETALVDNEERLFYCPDDDKEFRAIGYPNPVFYADTVANCPICKQKCWEKTVKITYSEYERLKKMGVQPRLFN